MAENYCGKSCSTCDMREVLCCPGCKSGPGRPFGGDCELARCCREKNHESCDTCTQKPACGKYHSADSMADYRLKKQTADRAARETAENRVAVLGKWLWAYFWLLIAMQLPGILTNEQVKEVLPELALVGEVLKLLLSLAVVGIFFKMSVSNIRYRKAGICLLLAAVVECLTALFFGAKQMPAGTLLITVPAMIVSFVGEYNEYVTHSEVLTHMDDMLAERWLRLWKWYIILFCAILGSLVLAFLLPILSVLLVLTSTIGLVVVAIIKLTYVYRMAKMFRTYAQRLEA